MVLSPAEKNELALLPWEENSLWCLVSEQSIMAKEKTQPPGSQMVGSL